MSTGNNYVIIMFQHLLIKIIISNANKVEQSQAAKEKERKNGIPIHILFLYVIFIYYCNMFL